MHVRSSDPTDRSGTVAPGEPPMRNRVTVAFDGLVAKLGLALTATLLTSLYLIAGPVAPTGAATVRPHAAPTCSQPHGPFAYGSSVVGIADTPDDGGYWIVNNAGQVAACGDASFPWSAGHSQQAHRRYRRYTRWGWLLPGRIRRWNLHLRRCRIPGFHGISDAQQAHRRHGGRSCDEGLLVGGLRRRDLLLQRTLPWLHRIHQTQQTRRGNGRDSTTEPGIGL